MTSKDSPESPWATGDAARRMAERVSATAMIADVAGDSVNRWVAIRLYDGGSDGVVYASRNDAISHQLHEQLCAYIWCPPGGMTPREAFVMLNFYRKVYDSGKFRMTDPEIIRPIENEKMRGMMRALNRA